MSSTTTTTSVPFSLLVTLKFSSLAYKNDFLTLFQPLAEYVRNHEPDTLQYQVLLSDKDELQAMILERYKDKEEAYLKTHKSSQAFQEFRPKLQAMQQSGHVSIDGHSYLDSGIGFDGRAS